MVKVNNIETNKVELEFTIDKESFDKACSKLQDGANAYRKPLGL